MPIHIGLTRRELLRRAAIGAGALAVPSSSWAGPWADRDRFALFSDTHISGNPGEVSRDVNMSDSLRKALSQVLSQDKQPSGLLITGDCAYLQGLPFDYAQLVGLLKPANDARLPVHFLLGYHDHRANIRRELIRGTDRPVLESKQVVVLKTRRANLFLLDSLDKVNVTPGMLGEEQLGWLQKSLDRNADKPAIIFVHHQPNFSEFGTVGGIGDTEALFNILAPRTHVKAIFFGHTHHWLIKEREGIHCVNLPPVAYVFNPTDPSGWIDLQLEDYGAKLHFNSLTPNHKAHGQQHRLAWR
jgi:3',5'-cyclic-AMP phosphodiesterase